MPQILASSFNELDIPAVLVVSALVFTATVGIAAGIIIDQMRKAVDRLHDIACAVQDLSARVVRLETRIEEINRRRD